MSQGASRFRPLPPYAGLFLFNLAAVVVSLVMHVRAEREALRQQLELSPTPLMRVNDPLAAASLQEQTIANASTALSNTSLSDLQNDNDTQRLQLRYRERKKQERLFLIQAQILQRLGISRQPNVTLSLFSEEERQRMAQIFERMRNTRPHSYMNEIERPIRLFAERLQSFYPSCNIPNNTERENWEDDSSFRLYYDVTFPRPSSATEISILSAKLRIFKIRDPDDDPNFVSWEPGQSLLPRHTSRYNLLDSLVHSSATNGLSISVYQYLKPLRINRRERKRLVDSRTIPADHRGWVELNIISTLSHWYHNKNKNFGMEVEVEDAFGNKLDPTYYLQNMNCSEETVMQEPPFPNIMEIHPEMGENESSLFDNETYPTLDLQTAELSREEPTVQASEVSSRLLRKRHSGVSHKSRRRAHGRCRREEVYVTFKDLGLDDLVIEPEGILWSFCTGGCNHHHYRNMHYQKEYNSVTHSSCEATRHSSLPILFYDNAGQMKRVILENFSAEECSCRGS